MNQNQKFVQIKTTQLYITTQTATMLRTSWIEDLLWIINYVFMLNDDVTAWMFKKQYTVLTSTIEVKFIALRHDAW